MFRNKCVHIDSFQNTNIKITCRVDEWIRNCKMNYDELSDINYQLTNPKDKNFHYSAKMLRLPLIILACKVVVRVIDRSQSFDCVV